MKESLIEKLKINQRGVSLNIILTIIIIVLILITFVLIFVLKKTDTDSARNNLNQVISDEYENENKIISTKITGSTPYLPSGFSASTTKGETTIEEGLVIKDGSGNEYVWIPVPNDGTGPNYDLVNNTQEDSDEYYNAIEQALSDYSYFNEVDKEYIDDWSNYSETTEEALGIKDYNALKRKMLKSIYENGGFYVGRYETGYKTGEIREISRSDDNYETKLQQMINMTANQLIESNKPVIQKDAYPYNYITCNQAQILADSFQSGEYTSSLLFGIQWNLMLKCLKNTGVDVYLNSKDWGNYDDSELEITSKNARQATKYPYNNWINSSSKKERRYRNIINNWCIK